MPVHLDAIAAYGSVPLDVHAVGADLVSISAHKIGGPVGIGALVVSRTATVEPLVHGGNQQRARSGTQDAAGAIAFGTAAGLIAPDHAPLAALRDRLIAGLAELPGVVLRGDPDPAGRLPGNVHATFAGTDGDALLYLLDQRGFSVSTGSACQAGVAEVSHVLLAMGVPEAEATRRPALHPRPRYLDWMRSKPSCLRCRTFSRKPARHPFPVFDAALTKSRRFVQVAPMTLTDIPG